MRFQEDYIYNQLGANIVLHVLSLLSYWVGNLGIVRCPRNVLGKASAPLPLVVECHSCPHSSLRHLIKTNIQTLEDLVVVLPWGLHKCRAHSEWLGCRSAF